MEKRKPRRLEVNNNLIWYNEDCIEPLNYSSNFESIILSYQDRYTDKKKCIDTIVETWKINKDDLRVK